MEHALRVLEFAAVLERLATFCETEAGAERALGALPQFAAEVVAFELERTRQAHELLGEHSPPSLTACRSLAKPLRRAEKGGALGGVELFQIAEALATFRAMRNFLSPRRETQPSLWALAEVFVEDKKLETTLLDSLDADGTVRSEASPQLATLRQRIKSTQSRVHERIQTYLTRQRDVLSDPIFTVRDGRYVIPVKSEHRGKVRGIVHDTSASGQTVYIEPDDVLQLGNALREAEAAERQEVLRILAKLSSQVSPRASEISASLELAQELDLILAKARLAYAMNAILPFTKPGSGLKVRQARHPLLEAVLTGAVVPIDIEVGFDQKGLLITGPNTGGKTVAIKTVGLFALMIHAGLYVPAVHAEFGPFTQVWADIGDEQSIQQSLSTFSAHVKNIGVALSGLKPGALALFDEIGAGTDPAEGAALAKAILEAFVARGAIVLASTHYGELKAFAYEREGFRNAAMEFDAKSLRPTYRVLMGAPGASHALKIAERYGLPKAVIDAARSHLDEGERDVARLLEQLEQAQRQARIAQGEADRRQAELKRAEERAKRKLEEADEIRRTVHGKATDTIEGAMRELRLEAQKLFDEVKASADEATKNKAREGLKKLQDRGARLADDYRPGARLGETKPISKGMSVRAEGFTPVGVVLTEPRNGKVDVQMGVLKMSFPVTALSPADKPKETGRGSIRLSKAQTASTELHLRAKRAEDAVEELEKFLDESALAGIHQVRIVHGKGEGILRKVTHEYLRKANLIASFRDGEPAEGGHGVTIAVFK